MQTSLFLKNRKGVDFTNPTFLAVVLLAVLLGIAFIFFILKFRAKIPS